MSSRYKFTEEKIEAICKARKKNRNRQFGCRGYYVDTVGKNEKKIATYIQEQLKEDELSEQLTLDLTNPFTGSRNRMQGTGRTCAVKRRWYSEALWAVIIKPPAMPGDIY